MESCKYSTPDEILAGHAFVNKWKEYLIGNKPSFQREERNVQKGLKALESWVDKKTQQYNLMDKKVSADIRKEKGYQSKLMLENMVLREKIIRAKENNQRDGVMNEHAGIQTDDVLVLYTTEERDIEQESEPEAADVITENKMAEMSSFTRYRRLGLFTTAVAVGAYAAYRCWC